MLKQRLADNLARGVDPTALEFDPGESRLDTLQAKLQSKQQARARTRAEFKRRVRAMFSTATADSQPADVDIPDQIRKLAELRDSGIISSDEFKAKKTELLSRM